MAVINRNKRNAKSAVKEVVEEKPKPVKLKKYQINIGTLEEFTKVDDDKIVKEISIYPKEKCSFVGEDGSRCTRNAVGQWNVCEKHGGDPVVPENLFSRDMIPDVLRGKVYDPSFHPMEYLFLSKSGMSAVEIAAEFEVTVRDLHKWAELYDEFNRAFEIGEALHEAWYLKSGKDNLDNRGYNVELFKFITSNKLGWSTKTESKNLNVHAGVLVVPKKKTEAEWELEHGSM